MVTSVDGVGFDGDSDIAVMGFVGIEDICLEIRDCTFNLTEKQKCLK